MRLTNKSSNEKLINHRQPEFNLKDRSRYIDPLTYVDPYKKDKMDQMMPRLEISGLSSLSIISPQEVASYNGENEAKNGS